MKIYNNTNITYSAIEHNSRKNTKGRTHNTNVDKSIDLKSYIASAQKTNQKIIDNAGTQINAKTSEYMSTGKAFRGDSYEDL